MSKRSCPLALRALAAALSLSLAGAAPAAAAGPEVQRREASVPLEIAAPIDAAADDHADAPIAGTPSDEAEALPEGPAKPRKGLPVRVDPGSAPIQVAIGLGAAAAGSRSELALVAELDKTFTAASAPAMTVRRLRAGGSEPKSVCRQRSDDLVIVVDYLPEREDAVLVPYDCSLDQALGIRAAEAAREPELPTVLWAEHQDLIRRGASERRTPLIAPRTRRFLIAGGAIVALGVALGFIIAATLRPSTVVVTVSP